MTWFKILLSVIGVLIMIFLCISLLMDSIFNFKLDDDEPWE